MSLESGRYAMKNLRRVLFRLNFVLSGCALALFAWNLASLVKELALDRFTLRLNDWATPFYRPQDASLLNYVVLCVVMGLYGLALYFRRGDQKRYLLMKRRTLANSFPLLLLASSPLFPVLLNRHWELSSRLLISLHFIFILFVPWSTVRLRQLRHNFLKRSQFWHNRAAHSPFRWGARRGGKILLALTLMVWCFLALEPIRLIKGPVYLINEFRDLYSTTRLDGRYVNNKEVLGSEELKGRRRQEFVRSNALEYEHQVNTRGPINHIGHILNPLNEYVSGKPLADVYMQYGWGNTLLYQFTMDLFGGASLHNYYKCYLHYVLYAVLFAIMLAYLFRRSLFVFYGSLFYATCFYTNSYLAFIIAPGIIPTIHLFDTTVLVLLTLYFKRGNPAWLLPALLLSAFSMYLNRQFGLVLFISLAASALFYLWENRRGVQRYLLSLAVLLLPFAVLALPVFKTAVNSSSTMRYFLTGFLSYRPDSVVVFLTVLYLVLCFNFLYLIRRETHPLKYAFLFAFVYSLGLLTYFYWSGLTNHLAPVLPFTGVALLLMMRLAQELLPPVGRGRTLLRGGLLLTAAGLVLAYGSAVSDFYEDKKGYQENFSRHLLYNWDFPRARVVSTIDPEPLRQSIALIHKYSPAKNGGIYLLSTYDKLLPFLAERYSQMPFFEMQWYLFTARERADAVQRLSGARPEFLFVGEDLVHEGEDPWAIYFDSGSINKERRSNEQRRLELTGIFAAVRDGYEKVDQGGVLSVYRRKPGPLRTGAQ